MLWFHNGFYILLTFILLGASAEPFPSFLFSSFAWISRFLWVSQKIKEFFRMPSVGVKDVDQQKFTVALAAFLKKSGKVSHLNFALLNRIFRQTYQTVMAAILRDVAAIGTVPGFQRRSRSSTEPILACWFLILLDYSMKSCRRNWDFEFVLASLRYSHFNSLQVKLPEWVDMVKTNVAKELAPYDEDWYYVRLASMARHIYVRSPVGVTTACKIYGGKLTLFLNNGLIRHFYPILKL